MTKQQKMNEIVALLYEKYPLAECGLSFGGDPWRLLVMARLSAQCTDAKVNEICKILFKKYPSAAALGSADTADVEKIIRPCGLHKTKAKSIVEISRTLVEKFGGIVPQDMDELLSFNGVGRKIANLVRGDLYGLGGIVADTHCIRLSSRWGITDKNCENPLKTEKALDTLVEKNLQSGFCHRVVLFGREVCTARNPHCESCFLAHLCKEGAKKTTKNQKT